MNKIAALALMMLTATPLLAQPAASPPQPSAAAKPPTTAKTPETQIDKRITQMHARLRITPDQEPTWTNFAGVMRANAAATDQAYRRHATTIGTMSAVENLRAFTQIEQTRAQGLQTLLASFETVYNGLATDQKQSADAIFRREEERAEQRKTPKR